MVSEMNAATWSVCVDQMSQIVYMDPELGGDGSTWCKTSQFQSRALEAPRSISVAAPRAATSHLI